MRVDGRALRDDKSEHMGMWNRVMWLRTEISVAL
jgi:hypothetical protein